MWLINQICILSSVETDPIQDTGYSCGHRKKSTFDLRGGQSQEQAEIRGGEKSRGKVTEAPGHQCECEAVMSQLEGYNKLMSQRYRCWSMI